MSKFRMFAAAAAVVFTINAQAQSIDEIVNKHIEARGGAEKLKGIKTLVIENSMTMQGMEIPMKQMIATGRGLRMEISVMGNEMITAIDGTKGWAIRPAMMGGTGEPEDLPADQIKSSTSQLDPAGPLFNYKEKGTKVELVGKEPVDKKENYHLKVTTKEGTLVDYFLDANTFLLTKQVASLNMQGQDVRQEMNFSDYKEVSGIKFPHTMETASPMGGDMTVTTNKITVNGPIDEKIFVKPTK
ncbi:MULTISPECIES: outer membrane lipoprotein-sorting protein [unclassified Siphonobacter]|uniref:outer membrane lipoprotein-sorting protein n=1 Tax=unclassified Siphonobacter TaxID=2635712 RepID=UPI000CC037D5|nr:MULTISPECIES: outer membrane lipoprotein-sorting protein [unclassified Siphonobacter]MDQ1088306.1 outer membrane lipoprotein-sorting protein [Siphonobacter sp. SORGH_AS_1065]MDR6194447.1 outer membrane lipoprotein-sorting protein [Siphonobacter sp. SORGH_AS_0500]PKK37741.1 outer membrane lipoprotein-sorting protein [Siphonobacter sp. SORGH_AS_0500]